MPGMRCAVAICNNSYFKTKLRPELVSYFRFPKDERVRKLWIERCKRKDAFNPNTSYICSDHFHIQDFVRDFRGELFNLGSKKKILTKDAIPSLKLLPCDNSNSLPVRSNRIEKRERKELVSVLLKQSIQPKEKGSIEKNEREETKKNGTKLMEMDATEVVESEIVSTDTNNIDIIDYKSEYLKIKEEFEQYKKEQEQKTQMLEVQCNSLQRDVSAAVSKEVQNVLSGVFSKTQIDLILNKKKRVKTWSNEDITRAFTIRYLSKRCYIHIRSKMGIPLPSLTTLKEWASKLKVHSGVLDGVINLMEVAAVKLSNYEKLTVIQYDEMKVMSVHEYDAVNDQAVGPHDQAQVIMVRSLCGSWKQPIFTSFDTKMTRACLDQVIHKLHVIGFTVVAIVSDCGGGNVGVWNDYKVSHQKCFFLSDITNRNIYFFADVPHLLKLIRNWYIDGGFVLPDGTEISPEPVKTLVNSTNNLEISSCHKLTPKHINCDKFQRQNVLLAAQLMSNTTSCALRRYGFCEETLRVSAANFIKATNDWFDVMNSRCPNSTLPLQCGYGLKIKEQKPVLKDYIKTIGKLKCLKNTDTEMKTEDGALINVEETKSKSKRKKKNEPALKLFQKGVIMSTNSLMKLYDELKKDFKLTYILTSKINQDSLENLFSLIRGSGGCNDHPTPMEFLYRLRLIVLGKNVLSRSNCNTRQTEDEFIVGRVLEATKVLEKNTTTTSVPSKENENEMDSEPEAECDSLMDEGLVDRAVPQVDVKPTLQETVKADGLCYISGWIAKKLKNKNPHLGSYTFKGSRKDKTWVKELSVGGLTEPSSEFESLMVQMESVFNKFMGQGLPKILGLKRKLIKAIKEEVKEEDDEIINLFARRRIIMRVKYLNKQKLNMKKSQQYKKLHKITS